MAEPAHRGHRPQRTGAADVAGGRTDPPAGALSTAVGSEIQTYPGVRSVHAYLTGDPDQPQMNLNVTVDPDVDVPRVRRRIVDEAVAHARTALDTPDLATQLKADRGPTHPRPPQLHLTPPARPAGDAAARSAGLSAAHLIAPTRRT